MRLGGCFFRIPDYPECNELRKAGLSAANTTLVHEWIDGVLADPASLAESGKTDGRLRSRHIEADPEDARG